MPYNYLMLHSSTCFSRTEEACLFATVYCHGGGIEVTGLTRFGDESCVSFAAEVPAAGLDGGAVLPQSDNVLNEQSKNVR